IVHHVCAIHVSCTYVYSIDRLKSFTRVRVDYRLQDHVSQMVNDSLRLGLLNDASSLRKLSLLSYNQLAQYDSPSCYKLCAISRAAGILAARKKPVRRGVPTRTPYAVGQQLVSCYGFKIENGYLRIPVSRGKRFSIPLTKHVLEG